MLGSIQPDSVSVVEDRQIELAEARGVGDRVDLDDLPIPDREAEYHKEPSTRSHDDSRGSVDERRSCGPGSPLSRPPGRGWRTMYLPRCRCAHSHGTAVCSEHDVRVEHRDKRVEVSASREAARKASTASRWRVRSASGTMSAPCTRRRARLASCLAALGERPTMGAISSKGTEYMSCSTKASRSAGAKVSSTTTSARPTESASSASCSGPIPSARLTIGSGTCTPTWGSPRG